PYGCARAHDQLTSNHRSGGWRYRGDVDRATRERGHLTDATSRARRESSLNDYAPGGNQPPFCVLSWDSRIKPSVPVADAVWTRPGPSGGMLMRWRDRLLHLGILCPVVLSLLVADARAALRDIMSAGIAYRD